MVMRLRWWLRSLFLRRRFEQDMQEEMAAHLASSTERLMARGLTAVQARHAARREFGNVDVLQEEARDARAGRWIESILADFRFGLRHLGRTPFSTFTMVVLLAALIKGAALMLAWAIFLHTESFWAGALRYIIIDALFAAAIAPFVFALLRRGHRYLDTMRRVSSKEIT